MEGDRPIRERQIKIGFAASILILVAGLLVWLPSPGSHAQQDRQLVQTPAANANSTKRIALVIGNGAYTNAPPLKNPPNDARDMVATLKELGFDVSSGINVTQREMKRLMREFGQKLKAGGSGLFYYAGHGVQSKGHNYLIPLDADIQSEADVEDTGVDVNLVLGYMDEAQNELNIVILDACRSNPFARGFRSTSNGLAQVDAPTGTLIAYATAPGRVASDGTGENGLYTSELLKQMRVPALSATDMFMHVRAEVIKQTGGKQVPWEASSLVGAFYFNRGRTGSGEGIGTGGGGGMGRGEGIGSGRPTPSPVVNDTTPAGVDYNKVFSSREVDERAKILSKPKAVYTDAARQNQVQGSVVVRVVLAASGQVTKITVVSGLPYGLSEQSIAAARGIKFEPAKKDGRPVSQSAQVEYTFTLY